MNEIALVRSLWAITVLVVVGVGFGCVWYPASQRITTLNAASRELYDEANAVELEVRRSIALSHVRDRVAADVRRLRGQGSRATATAAALHLLSDESRKFNVEVRSVVPQTASSVQDPLVPNEVTLGLRGAFRNVVAMLVDLPRHDVLLGIRDVAFVSSRTQAGGVSALDVTVHATLYRVSHVKALEDNRATSAP